MDIGELIVSTDREIEDLERRAIATLQGAIDAAYRNVIADIEKRYLQLLNDDSGSRIVATKRSLRRLEQLKTLLSLLDPRQGAAIAQETTDVFDRINTIGSEFARATVLAIDPGLPWNPDRIPIEAATAAARDTASHLYRYSEAFQAEATAIITTGLLQQWGIPKVARALRDRLSVLKSKAETIARTEVLHSFNAAATSNYARNQIEYVQVIATVGDLRTCALCRTRNLNVYPIGKVSVPFHPRCRCFLMPYQKGWRSSGLINETWEREYYQQGFKADDKKNIGLAPFEKMNGLSKPPKPTWTASP